MIKTENGVYDIDPDDCYIRNHMMSGRVYEYHIINGYLKQFVTRSKYIVDAGANIGCHTVSYGLFNPECKIWSFEPQKKLFDILVKNVKQNNIKDRVKIYNAGLGHTEMDVNLVNIESVEDKAHMGWNKGGMGIGKGGEKMKLMTIDSLDLPGLDYMKIDVEGAEGLVIQGAKKTIEKFHPIICFEHNGQRINPEDVGVKEVSTPFQELVKLGYRNFVYLDWENYLAIPEVSNHTPGE